MTLGETAAVKLAAVLSGRMGDSIVGLRVAERPVSDVQNPSKRTFALGT